jgi:hypothetical protein
VRFGDRLSPEEEIAMLDACECPEYVGTNFISVGLAAARARHCPRHGHCQCHAGRLKALKEMIK